MQSANQRPDEITPTRIGKRNFGNAKTSKRIDCRTCGRHYDEFVTTTGTRHDDEVTTTCTRHDDDVTSLLALSDITFESKHGSSIGRWHTHCHVRMSLYANHMNTTHPQKSSGQNTDTFHRKTGLGFSSDPGSRVILARLHEDRKNTHHTQRIHRMQFATITITTTTTTTTRTMPRTSHRRRTVIRRGKVMAKSLLGSSSPGSAAEEPTMMPTGLVATALSDQNRRSRRLRGTGRTTRARHDGDAASLTLTTDTAATTVPSVVTSTNNFNNTTLATM